jgi:hypothetical protein
MLAAGFTVPETLYAVLFKGLDVDTVQRVAGKVGGRLVKEVAEYRS